MERMYKTEERVINNIGIDIEKSAALSEMLNELLADYQVFYQNLRGLHWNIRGNIFFELHAKFEEYYNDAVIKIDEIAERILTLGGQPMHTFSDYLETSVIKVERNVADGKKAVEVVINNLSVIIKKERTILDCANEAGDEGTATLVGDYIAKAEKTLWMLNAYLG